tara:strand:+ start:3482 stop:4075 length:594 start_codon:yes stop_codon:yes gene_type:complete
MAITNGINIDCENLQASGGIRNLLIRTWTTGDVVTYSNTATAHSILSLTDVGGGTATWHNYEFKNELPSLTVTAAKENGSTAYDCALSFMMPEMTNEKGAALQSLMDSCMMVMAIGNNGKNYVLGVSQKYQNENTAGAARNQTYSNMTGAEGASGAAYNDDNGWTVTMGCKQWEAPRLYMGTVTLYSASNPGQSTTT